ncbi:MAG TPA: hypothetical protein VGQ89_04625 [Candidatus Limnocylindrales bacterium]|nr:hypothetical protein [Candidatus Limnocylindrales bacterium]
MRLGLPWAIAALTLIAFLAAVLFRPSRGQTFVEDLFLAIAFSISYGGVGAFLTVRVPRNPIGPLLLAATMGFALMSVCERYALASLELAAGSWPGTALVALLGLMLWPPSLAIALIGVPLIFPDGRLISPRWRWVVVGSVFFVGAASLGTVFTTGYLTKASGLVNPMAIPALEPWLGPLIDLSELGAIPVVIAAVSAPLVRYRRGGPVERHQIRWLAAGTFIVVVGFLGSSVAPIAETIGVIALAVLPISIGIAILRYRLYEIDRLISRTLAYAVLTAVLAAVYALCFLVLQAAVAPFMSDGGPIVVAASTLAAFALSQPLRRQFKATMDRHFNRSRYDAQRTVEAFAAQLRDEFDLERLRGELRSVVGSSLGPTSVGVWLRQSERTVGR